MRLHDIWSRLRHDPLGRHLPRLLTLGGSLITAVALFIDIGYLHRAWIWPIIAVVVVGLIGVAVDIVRRWRREDAARRGIFDDHGRRSPWWPPPRRTAFLGAGGVLLIGGWLVWDHLHPGVILADPEARVAILPFRVEGADPSLGPGMVGMLDQGLTDGRMKIVDVNYVQRVWEDATREVPDPFAHEVTVGVARRVGARYALSGRIIQLGSALTLSAQFHEVGEDGDDASNARELEVSGSSHPDSLLPLVRRLGKRILVMGVGRDERDLPPIEDVRSISNDGEAWAHYEEGERALRHSRWAEAIAHYDSAVQRDTTFSLALLRLSLAYGWQDGPGERRTHYARRAARHVRGLPVRDSLLVVANWQYDQQRPVALRTLRKLTADFPEYSRGWYGLGEAYYHMGGTELRTREEMRDAFERAIELDAYFSPAYIHLVHDAFDRGDARQTRRLLDTYRELEPTSTQGKGFELAYAVAFGDSARRASAARLADSLVEAHLPPPSGEASTGRFGSEGRGDSVALEPDAARQRTRYEVLQNALLTLQTTAAEPGARAALAALRSDDPLDLRQSAHRVLARTMIARGHADAARETLMAMPMGPDHEGPPMLSSLDARMLLSWSLVGLASLDSTSIHRSFTALDRRQEGIDWFVWGALHSDFDSFEQVNIALRNLDPQAAPVPGDSLAERADSAAADSAPPPADSVPPTAPESPPAVRPVSPTAPPAAGPAASDSLPVIGGIVEDPASHVRSVNAALAQALTALATAQRGDTTSAIQDLANALEAIPAYCVGDHCLVHGYLRYRLSRWLIATEQPRFAEAYLRSIEQNYNLSAAQLRLAQAYEELGDEEEARARYRRFLTIWTDPDDNLVFLREEAEAGLRRLASSD